MVSNKDHSIKITLDKSKGYKIEIHIEDKDFVFFCSKMEDITDTIEYFVDKIFELKNRKETADENY